MRVNFFAKTKTNISNLPLSRWNDRNLKNSKILKLKLYQQAKEIPVVNNKLWEKLIVLNRRKKKATNPKKDVNFLSLKRVKFVKMTIFYSL